MNPRDPALPFQCEHIPAPNADAELLCRTRLNVLTKPAGSLGVLEELAVRLAGIRGFPPTVNRPAVLIFAGDHGVTDEGVSAFPKAVTPQMVANFLSGGAAINVFSKLAGANVTIIDAGVDADLSNLAGLVHRKVRRGTRNMVLEDAMTRAEASAAIALGREQAALAIERGAEILCLGEMGIGNTTSAAALVSALLPMDVLESVGRGTGVDDAGLERKRSAVKRALARHGENTDQSAERALGTLCAVGGLEIAALCGAFFAAAARRTPVLVDGYIVSSAALCALRLNPAVAPYLFFAHRSTERGHAHLLAGLGVRPLLECDLRLGEGTGAVLALPLLKAACTVLTEMATFTSAGVANKA